MAGDGPADMRCAAGTECCVGRGLLEDFLFCGSEEFPAVRFLSAAHAF